MSAACSHCWGGGHRSPPRTSVLTSHFVLSIMKSFQVKVMSQSLTSSAFIVNRIRCSVCVSSDWHVPNAGGELELGEVGDEFMLTHCSRCSLCVVQAILTPR